MAYLASKGVIREKNGIYTHPLTKKKFLHYDVALRHLMLSHFNYLKKQYERKTSEENTL